MHHTGKGIFKNLPRKIKVGLYHSWVIAEENHKNLRVFSVHPGIQS